MTFVTDAAAADPPLRAGGFLIVGKASEDTALVQRPGLHGRMDRREFEAQWDGRLVLMARRVGLLDLSRRFDITWLLQLLSRARLQAKMLGAARISETPIFAVVSDLLRLCVDPMKAKQHHKGEKALFAAGVRGSPDPVLKRAVFVNHVSCTSWLGSAFAARSVSDA